VGLYGCGKLGQTSTDFEVKQRNSARNLGIDPSSPEKAAREAACYAPFLSIRQVSAECISLETITSPQEKMGEIGSRDALDLPFHLLFLPLFSSKKRTGDEPCCREFTHVQCREPLQRRFLQALNG
jgi:hypothetical protein